MLRALMKKKRQTACTNMDNVRREMESLRKNQIEMLEIKSSLKGMKNIFDGLISRLNMAEERIFEFEDISIETSKLKSKGKKPAKKNRMSKKCETSIKGITTYVMAIPEKKRKRGICSTNA